jgi:thiol-disulfide isomerase/thioredoxin
VRARRSTAKITTDKGLTMPNRASRMRTACLAVLLLAAALPGAARPADDAPAADRATLTVADFDLAAHAGKVVLVDFWASWCKPCQVSLPWLSRLAAEHSEDLVVLAVNLDRNLAAAERMLADIDPHVVVIHDPKGELAGRYDLAGMPTSFLYDRAGVLRATHVGFLPAEADARKAEIIALLDAKE